MFLSIGFYLSVLVFWGIPIAMGAAFWQMALFWGAILCVLELIDVIVNGG